MTLPVSVLDFMVYGALLVSAVTPIVLLVLLFRDWKGGKLW
jgi:hypothetical protein